MSSSPAPNSSNRLPSVLLLLAAIGVPSAAGLAFAHTITQYPWQAVSLGLLYEVALLIVGFVTKVWQRLESDWVKQVADCIDGPVQEVFSSYQRHYCEYLRYEHRDFDVKGLSTQGAYTLALEQVFVQLSMVPKPVHSIPTNPLLQVPEELRMGEHSIWDYLTSETLKQQQLAIIGAPGSGKTTLLKHIALTLVNKKQRRQYSIAHTLPILLFLRDHSNALKDASNFCLVDAVQAHINKWGQPAPSGWVARRLLQGRCLVLLDGLDEVADLETRRHMVNWVQRQMVAYGKNRFIITSRPFGYRSNPLSGVTVLQVHPFTAEQVKRFVHNWYIANEIMSSQRDDPGVHMKAQQGAEDLLRRLRNAPALFELAVNPLLLTMIATVHRYRSSLPGKRVALYAEMCEVFLGKRQEARGITLELSPAQKLRVLQPLAYHMMLKGIREISYVDAQKVIEEPLILVSQHMLPEAFLQDIENTSGVLLERETGIYSFAHLTFQEYITATHVRENKLVDMLVAQVGASWWHETIRLYCAQADATPIIAACLAGEHPSVPALMLALDCQKEALEVQPAVLAQLNTLLDQGIEDADSEMRRIVAEALLARRLREMVHLKDDIYRGTSLITCAEYQVFLDEQRERGEYCQPDHWTDVHFPAGGARNAVLGVRPSDAVAFCAWLTQRESSVWRYRLPREGEHEAAKESASDQPRVGYWTNEGKGFMWIKGSSRVSDSVRQEPDNSGMPLGLDLLHTETVALAEADTFDLSCIENAFADASTRICVLTDTLAKINTRGPDDTRANDGARVFASALVDILANACPPAYAFDLLACDLGDASTRAHARADACADARSLANALAGTLARANALAHVRDISYLDSLPLVRALARAGRDAVDLVRNRTSGRDRVIVLARDLASIYVRSIALACVLNVIRRTRHRSDTTRGGRPIRHSLDSAMDVYEALTRLEMRMRGEFPACEGILIVKERNA